MRDINEEIIQRFKCPKCSLKESNYEYSGQKNGHIGSEERKMGILDKKIQGLKIRNLKDDDSGGEDLSPIYQSMPYRLSSKMIRLEETSSLNNLVGN